MSQNTIRVLITTSPEVARAFEKFSCKRKTESISPFDSVYNNLTKVQKDTLFINPRDERSYSKFKNLEYSIGFSSSFGRGETSNNFTITFTLLDKDNSLDQDFVNSMFDYALTKNYYNEVLNNYLNTQDANKKIEVGRNIFLGDKPNFPSRIAVASRNFYFVFINDIGEYVGPLVSEFFATELKQHGDQLNLPTNQVYRELKVTCVCTGNPTIISQLASIKNFNPSLLSKDPNRSLVLSEYTVEHKNVGLLNLSMNLTSLDYFIKDTIKQLFEKVTSKQILLLLPDFGQIYQNYKNNHVNNLLGNNFDSLFNSYLGSVVSENYKNTLLVRRFLNDLGFELFDVPEAQVATFVENLDADEKKKLKDLSDKVTNLKNQLKQANQTVPALVGFLSYLESPDSAFSRNNYSSKYPLFSAEELDQRLYSGSDYAKSHFKNSSFSKFIADQTAAVTTLFGNPYPGRTETDTLSEQLFKLTDAAKTMSIGFEDLNNEINSILDILYYQRLVTLSKKYKRPDITTLLTGNVRRDAAAVTEASDAISAGLNLDIIFKVTSTEEPQSGVPKRKGFIDFNEFANNFSNKLNRVSQGPDQYYRYNITYTEENNLARLKNIKDNIKYKKESAIRTSDDSCIIIYDDHFFDVYYCALNGVGVVPIKNYPMSSEDKDNYSKDGSFVKKLIENKSLNAFSTSGIMTSFTKNVNYFPTEEEQIILKNTPEAQITQKQRNAISLNPFVVADNLLTEEIPSYSDVKSQSLNPLPLFIFNPNPPGSSTKTSIINFTMDSNTLNSFASFTSYLKYLEDSFVTEYFNEIKLNHIKNFLGDNGYEEIYKKLVEYVKGGGIDNGIVNQVKTSLEVAINKPNTDLTRLLNYFSNELIYDASKGPPDDAAEEKISLVKKKAIDQMMLILFDSAEYLPTQIGTNETNTTIRNARTEALSQPAQRVAELYRQIYSKVYTLTIKTHSFLQINSIGEMNSPSIVLIYNYQYGNLDYKVSNVPYTSQISPISGFYRIIGFKHTLSNVTSEISNFNSINNGYSEFLLIKDPGIGGF